MKYFHFKKCKIATEQICRDDDSCFLGDDTQ